jgi:hypothetical protein
LRAVSEIDMALRVMAAARNRYHQALLVSPSRHGFSGIASTRIVWLEDEASLR